MLRAMSVESAPCARRARCLPQRGAHITDEIIEIEAQRAKSAMRRHKMMMRCQERDTPRPMLAAHASRCCLRHVDAVDILR